MRLASILLFIGCIVLAAIASGGDEPEWAAVMLGYAIIFKLLADDFK